MRCPTLRIGFRVTFGTLAGTLVLLGAGVGDVHAQVAPLPNVQNRFLPEAVDALRGRGFQDVRVAHWRIDDLPPGLVRAQFPEPTVSTDLSTAPRTVPLTTPIWLVVTATPLVLPDFSGWPADHALSHIRAMDLRGEMLQAGVDSAAAVVTGQRPPPGFVADPQTLVVLVVEEAGPTQIRVDTVVVEVTETVVDTVTVTQAVEGEATDTVVLQITHRIIDTITITETIEAVVVREITRWELLAATGLGGLALGALGVMGSARLRRTPTLPRKLDDEATPGRRRPHGPDLPPFSPVIVDEDVRVARGRVIPVRDEEPPDASAEDDPPLPPEEAP